MHIKVSLFLIPLTLLSVCADEFVFPLGEKPVREIRDKNAKMASPEPMKIGRGALFCAADPKPEIILPERFGASGELTVSLWLKLNKSMTGTGDCDFGLLFKGRRGDWPRLHFQLALRRERPEFKYIDKNGNWCGIMRNSGDWVGKGKRVPFSSLPALKPDCWIMLTATYRNGRIITYVDGKPFFETENNPPMLLNRCPVIVGAAQSLWGNRYWMFPGLIARPRFSDRAYSSEEVMALFRKEFPLLDPAIRADDVSIPKPGFAKKLRLVEKYERNLPAPVPGRPNCEVRIVKVSGIPRIAVNGIPQSGTAMLPSPYVPDRQIFLSIRDFAAAGVRFYSNILWTQGKRNDWWSGEGNYDFKAVDRKLGAMLKAAPAGYIFPRIKLDPPEWWIRENPDEMTGSKSYVSPASAKWRKLYGRMLRDLVAHIENSSYAGRVIGYQFGALVGSEWIAHRVDGPATVHAFREYLRSFYGNDENALRRDYPGARFDTVTPSAPGRPHSPLDPMPGRDVSAAKRNLLAFRAKCVTENILNAAKIIKDVTGGRKLTGIFYGYGIPEHRGLNEILRSPLIDFICSPTMYQGRNPGEPGRFSSNFQASYRLNNKLYYDEADIRTYLYPFQTDYRCKTLSDTLNVLKRTIGYSLTQGNEAWWFLLTGNATFHDESIMEIVAKGAAEAEKSLKTPERTAAEVAVFYSSTQYCGASAFGGSLGKMITFTLPCAGAPYDTYQMEDLLHPDFPDYKVYLFLNAFELPSGVKNAVEKRLRGEGRTAVWIYNPAHSGIGTEMHWTPEPEPLSAVNGKREIGLYKLARTFSVKDPSARIFGSYGGRPSMARKGNSIWLLTPPDEALLRKIFRDSGVHVWNDSGDVFSAGRGFVMLHASKAGNKKISLPYPAKVREIFGEFDSKTAITEINDHFRFGETKIYRVEKQ